MNVRRPNVTNGDFATQLFPNYFGQDLLIMYLTASAVYILFIPVKDDIVAENGPRIQVENVLSFHAKYTHAKMDSHKRETHQSEANNLRTISI